MIKEVYEILLNSFGHQGWWPVTPIGCRGDEFLPIYGVRGLTGKQRFEIVVGAILTQNTAWKNVEKAIYNLNKAKLIDIKKISRIKKEKLSKLIKPAGYYNQKAERLKIIADFLLKNPIEKLNKLPINELREKLLTIKGIGPETADSMLLYAFEKPIFVIDAYTKRIFERLSSHQGKTNLEKMRGDKVSEHFDRLGFKVKDYDQWQKLFMENLDNDLELFKEYHALLVELGKNYCKKMPNCIKCPIENICKK